MSDQPITITGARLATLEHRVDGIHNAVSEIGNQLAMMRDAMERADREATESRRAVKRDLACVVEKTSKYVPMLEEMAAREVIRKDRREKIKTQVIGWGLVAILGGIGTVAYQWVQKAITVVNGGAE